MNEAVTEEESVTVMVHSPVPLQGPDHPENVSFGPAVSVRVTGVFCGRLTEQVEGQLMPAGLLVTVPEPETATVKVDIVWGGGGGGGGVVCVPVLPPPQDERTCFLPRI